MPTIGPQQQSFQTFIHLVNGKESQPQFHAYWSGGRTPSAEEIEALQKHEETGDIEFTLRVTYWVTEDQFKRSTKHYRYEVIGDGKESADSVINRLEQTHPGGMIEFAKHLWGLAPGFPQAFPQLWPVY